MTIDINELKRIISELKSQYGRVFITEFGNHITIWRELTRREYKNIMLLAQTPDEVERLICSTAILYPLEEELRLAGITQQLSTQIVEVSGFGSMHQAISYYEYYKEQMNNFENQAEVIIKTAFPTISFDEMLDWTTEQFMFKLAQAEWSLKEVLDHKIGIKINEEAIEQEENPEIIKEIAAKMRESGIDPMLAFGDAILEDKPFLDLPLIGGSNQWKDGKILDAIQQQTQAVLKRQQILQEP